LSKKTAIITAAGRGIGAAIARDLHAHGYRLALLSASGGAEILAEELGGIGLTGSVTVPGDLERLVAAAMDAHGRIDAVVNNTGHAPKADLLDIPDEDWHTGLDLLLLNVVRMARLVTPIMRTQGGGAIVNISTFAAFEPDLAFPVSSSLRAALGAFTKLYADRHAADGIRMNSVLPGYVDSYPDNPDLREKIPMKRYGTVEELAAAVRFLVSDESAYLTGQNIRMDGGLTRSV
jgi:NAD(P)-dependent dehydrogenase (short-subunit alcohol dehydrogenase family)